MKSENFTIKIYNPVGKTKKKNKKKQVYWLQLNQDICYFL